jgi:hypothetical protein
MKLKGWSLFELTLESYLRDMMAVAEASSGYHEAVEMCGEILFSSIFDVV